MPCRTSRAPLRLTSTGAGDLALHRRIQIEALVKCWSGDRDFPGFQLDRRSHDLQSANPDSSDRPGFGVCILARFGPAACTSRRVGHERRVRAVRGGWNILPRPHCDRARNACNSDGSDRSTASTDSLMAGRDRRKAKRPARRHKASPDECEITLCRERFPEARRISLPGDPQLTSYPYARP